MTSIYGNLPHVETDERPLECWRYGGIRCGHIDGRCNGERYPYDNSTEVEIKRMNEELKYE